MLGGQQRLLSDSPAYSGQYSTLMRVPGAAQLLPTTVTSGVIANVYGINTSGISGFATRFGSTFDEYRIVGAEMNIRPVNSASGISVMWYDEKSTSTPTSNEAQQRIGRRIPNTNAQSKSMFSMKWRARDLLDLQYTAIGSAVTPVSFKLYTDTAAWGAPAVVTNLWILEPVFTIEFRGLKST